MSIHLLAVAATIILSGCAIAPCNGHMIVVDSATMNKEEHGILHPPSTKERLLAGKQFKALGKNPKKDKSKKNPKNNNNSGTAGADWCSPDVFLGFWSYDKNPCNKPIVVDILEQPLEHKEDANDRRQLKPKVSTYAFIERFHECHLCTFGGYFSSNQVSYDPQEDQCVFNYFQFKTREEDEDMNPCGSFSSVITEVKGMIQRTDKNTLLLSVKTDGELDPSIRVATKLSTAERQEIHANAEKNIDTNNNNSNDGDRDRDLVGGEVGACITCKNRASPNTISICVKEMILVTVQDSDNTLVECYDKDSGFDSDDPMTSGYTGKNGCTTMTYKNQRWDLPFNTDPDIYCMVTKRGFMTVATRIVNNADQNKVTKMNSLLLRRDRQADYGEVNGCGPDGFSAAVGLNALATWYTAFGEQCTMHDKCYWDCKIFKEVDWDRKRAQEFCDREMYEGMLSYCHLNSDQVLSGDLALQCEDRANKIYTTLQLLGGKMAYDKTVETCGSDAPSMKNDYSHRDCHINGFKCGSDGTFSDDFTCHHCCNGGVAKDRGTMTDDHYCHCLPTDLQCGSNLVTNNYDSCPRCCSGKKRKDAGFMYSDYYCD